MKLFTILSAFILALLTGCASVDLADPAKDQAAKAFKAPSNAAGLYIYRNETFGAAVKLNVAVNGKSMGQTASKTYFYTEVPAGKVSVTSFGENVDTLDIDAKPGMLYYVWQEIKMGVLGARTKLGLVTEAVGKQGVNESKLIKSN